MSFKESDVRDSLSGNLHLIEIGLKFRKKEEFLPNDLGTRGFIDITAYDQHNRLVLIEVKKTGPATREAIHEIIKYLEGAKSYLGLREDEIRLIVVSVEWTELLLPFSSLFNRVTFQVEGYKAEIDTKGNVTDISKVPMLPVSNGRFIAPWHELHYYSQTYLSKGLKSFAAFCKNAKITDYIILELKPSEQHPQGIASPKERSMVDMIKSLSFDSNLKLNQSVELPLYTSILYFGMQMLDKAAYINILKDINYDDDTLLLDDKEDGMDVLCALHEALTEAEPRPVSDFYEIGYPAKLKCRLLEEDGWILNKIHRYGSFSRNDLLLDETILDEFCGSQGASRQRFSRTFYPNNASEVEEVLIGVRRCLEDNQPWKKQISHIIYEIAASNERRIAKIDISNPSTGLLTFYLANNSTDNIGYVPNYTIVVGEDESQTVYCGGFRYVRRDVKLNDLLDEHFDGSTLKMLMSLLWGGYENKDVDIMRSLGLRYRSFKFSTNAKPAPLFELTDEGWEASAKVNPLQAFFDLYSSAPNLMEEIFNLYSSRWQNGTVNLSGIK